MDLSSDLLLVLLIAVCLPVLELIERGHYLRFSKGAATWGLVATWSRNFSRDPSASKPVLLKANARNRESVPCASSKVPGAILARAQARLKAQGKRHGRRF